MHDNNIPTEDPRLDHGLAADPQRKQLIGGVTAALVGHITLNVLHRQNRLAGGDHAQQRHLGALLLRQGYSTVHLIALFDVPGGGKLRQILVDGRGGFDLQSSTDLPHRGRNAALSLGQILQHLAGFLADFLHSTASLICF